MVGEWKKCSGIVGSDSARQRGTVTPLLKGDVSLHPHIFHSIVSTDAHVATVGVLTDSVK